MTIRPGDSAAARKERGAFFTPPAIADYLADWAVQDQIDARVLDPTCGEAAFLLAAGRRLQALGVGGHQMDTRLFGVDLHDTSLAFADHLLREEGFSSHLMQSDFFDVATPDQIGAVLPEMDAVIGNPPFVRYQRHIGSARDRSKAAALRQGVRLSNLASSWAALLVHACGFLKPEGRLAMVLPAELLTVGYGEPVREWLKRRFAQVHLVMFDRLQFPDATERVVLVLASGHGGCDAFSLYYLDDGEDLARVRPMSNHAAPVLDGGKWTDLLLPNRQRRLFRSVAQERFQPLGDYGAPELGIVTGNNDFFTLSEETRVRYRLDPARAQVIKVCPPGTRHLDGTSFSVAAWAKQRDEGARVWLFSPGPDDQSAPVKRYVRAGEDAGVQEAYKCRIRPQWWRPPVVSAPDLFFTYMSLRAPVLITNGARTTFVNSMHGVRLREGVPRETAAALPLLTFNSVTLLGAEIFGRSYGGGILKMEPREASQLPLPRPEALTETWATLRPRKATMDRELRRGAWTNVVREVDDALLRRTLGMSESDMAELHQAARTLRARRLGSKGSKA